MISYLQIENLSKSFGDRVLFENISFGISEGQKVALISKNGMGKTTLLNIIAAQEDFNEGNISFKKDLKISFLQQEPAFLPHLSVFEACYGASNEILQTIKEYEELMAMQAYEKEALEERYHYILNKMDLLQAWDYEVKIKQILGKLKIENLEQKISSLSGGQIKRIALANALITEPDFLILDEPTNHLDLEMVEWLEDFLKRSSMTLLMVTHDRYFLNEICSDILEIDNRQLYHYKGNFSYYLEKRDERIANSQIEVE